MTNLLAVILFPISSPVKSRNVHEAFSFLHSNIVVILLTAISLFGCVTAQSPDSTEATSDTTSSNATEFYQDGFGRFLHDGEKIEYYGICNSKAKVAITNDRVLLLPPGYRLDNEIYWSIEHIEINRIDLPKEKSIWGGTFIREIHLYPYDSVDAEILYCDSSGRKNEITQITQAIQTQINRVNDIREQFGISIPETVTTAELKKLNEPVVSELKARRNNLDIGSQDKVVKHFPNEQCPDVSGIYYDRSADSYISQSSGQDNTDYMSELLSTDNENKGCSVCLLYTSPSPRD